LEAHKAPRFKQDESKAHTFSKLPKDFNRIDLTEGIETAYKKVKALASPYNGAYIEANGKKLIIDKVRMI
jgi:methionyl-tRNA formyltransferase